MSTENTLPSMGNLLHRIRSDVSEAALHLSEDLLPLRGQI